MAARPEEAAALPEKRRHWLMAAVVFGLVILWVIPVDASILVDWGAFDAAR